jgi:hypothetical protein
MDEKPINFMCVSLPFLASNNKWARNRLRKLWVRLFAKRPISLAWMIDKNPAEQKQCLQVVLADWLDLAR